MLRSAEEKYEFRKYVNVNNNCYILPFSLSNTASTSLAARYGILLIYHIYRWHDVCVLPRMTNCYIIKHWFTVFASDAHALIHASIKHVASKGNRHSGEIIRYTKIAAQHQSGIYTCLDIHLYAHKLPNAIYQTVTSLSWHITLHIDRPDYVWTWTILTRLLSMAIHIGHAVACIGREWHKTWLKCRTNAWLTILWCSREYFPTIRCSAMAKTKWNITVAVVVLVGQRLLTLPWIHTSVGACWLGKVASYVGILHVNQWGKEEKKKCWKVQSENLKNYIGTLRHVPFRRWQWHAAREKVDAKNNHCGECGRTACRKKNNPKASNVIANVIQRQVGIHSSFASLRCTCANFYLFFSPLL